MKFYATYKGEKYPVIYIDIGTNTITIKKDGEKKTYSLDEIDALEGMHGKLGMDIELNILGIIIILMGILTIVIGILTIVIVYRDGVAGLLQFLIGLTMIGLILIFCIYLWREW
jgi:hypothetical protein